MKLLIAGIVALLTAGALAQQPVATCADPLIAPSGGRYGITPTRQDYSDGALLCLAMGGVAANIPTEDADFLNFQGFPPFFATYNGQPPPPPILLGANWVVTRKQVR